MGHEYGHPTCEFALFTLAHVFDLIGDMFDIQGIETPGPEQSSLFVSPSYHVVIVTGFGLARILPPIGRCLTVAILDQAEL